MESRFDALAKAFATGMSRRDALRTVGGSVAAAALAYFGIGCDVEPTGPESAGHPLLDARGRCKKGEQKCRVGSECCSGFCNPSTGKCACGPGTYICPATAICVACDSSTVFDPLSCTCRCEIGETNCGTVGNLKCCSPGQTCVNGACSGTVTCPTGQTPCNGTCVNVQTSAANCGSCGNACPAGQSCVSGACATVTTCQQGQTLCNGTCVDTNTDNLNCGACGIVCSGVGQPCGGGGGTLGCVAGQCVCTCDQGLTLCPAGCVDTNTSATNCGSCGNTCATGESCVGGVCTSTCPTGQTLCSGACVETNTDANNCGGCGNICAAGKTCVNGTCNCTTGTICGTQCCPPGYGCAQGVCYSMTTCGPPLVACGNNCCGPNQYCEVMNSVCTCPPDTRSCGSIDCCTYNQVCMNGACVPGPICFPGQTTCGSTCCSSSQICDPRTVTCQACSMVPCGTTCCATGCVNASTGTCS